MTRILFVCLGNICRSPTAEAVTRALAAERGIDLMLDSAGTGGWHIGKPPHPPMIAAARGRGYDLAPLRARQITPDDFAAFDLILGMDLDNLDAIGRIRPKGSATPVRLFLDPFDTKGTDEVPDPYFTDDYEGALDLVERGAARLLDQLCAQTTWAKAPKDS